MQIEENRLVSWMVSATKKKKKFRNYSNVINQGNLQNILIINNNKPCEIDWYVEDPSSYTFLLLVPSLVAYFPISTW